jgi:hypothetical protein
MTHCIKTEVEIAASPERVWAVLIDYARYAEWNPYIVRIDGEPRTAKTLVVHIVFSPGAPPSAGSVDVLAVEPPRLMQWEGGLPDRTQWRGDHHWVVEPRGTGALVRHFEHFSGTLADAILAEHGDTIRANFVRFNDALKMRAEEFG